jgi:uncharacterized protein YdaU (DUF1376 family)
MFATALGEKEKRDFSLDGFFSQKKEEIHQ